MSINATPHVLAHFPNAKKSSAYNSAFLWFVRHVLKKKENDIALLLSIFSDDLNNLQIPDTEMIGPFMLGDWMAIHLLAERVMEHLRITYPKMAPLFRFTGHM